MTSGLLGGRRDRMILAALLAIVMTASVTLAGLRGAAGDVTTISTDTARSAWDSDEPGLGADTVTSSDFGQQFTTTVNGQVYAQPLAVGGTLIVATENDYIYGLDADTGAVKWSRSVGAPWPASAISCGDLTPNIGITSTPVYDPADGSVYFTAKVDDGADVDHPHWYMHAVDPATGAERPGWPVTIQGAPGNDVSTPFTAKTQLQRAGLLLLNGVVYAGFGSHCDHGVYRGYVVGVSTAQAKISAMWATEVGASNSKSGVWHAGGGLVSDGSGRIFLATGNGVMPPAGPGTKPPGTLSESVVRLNVSSTGALTTGDFFSPANADTLDSGDKDLGSGGPVALPDSFGTSAHPHLLVQQGKDGRIFLLDRDDLGGRRQGGGGTDAALGVIGPYQGQWGHPAAWTSTAGSYVYFADNGGPLRAFKGGANGATPALTKVGESSTTFPYTSGSPVITSSGGDPASGVVWVIRSGSGSTGTDAQLQAYSAIPSNGTLRQLFASPIGTMSKFSVPAVDNGHVYVGTRDGKVIGFGRPATSTLTGAGVDFGHVAVGSSGGKSLVLTATRPITVTAVTTTAPFSATPAALPVTLDAGGTVSVPVGFQPSAPGDTTALATVATDSGSFAFTLTGVGTQPGLGATPAAASFTDQPAGTSQTVNVQVTNTGETTETIGSATGPGGPFTVQGLPAAGDTIAPGTSVVIAVTYAPAATGSSTSQITLTSTSGTLKIPVTGNAVTGQAHLALTPATLDFGSLAAGSARTLDFDLTNTGNIATTISLAKAPAGDFTSAAPLPEGTVIGPGQVIHQSVTYTPSTVGQGTASYTINSDSGQGVMNENLTGVGTGPVPAPSTPTWSTGGSGVIQTGGRIQLTPAQKSMAGSAFYPAPVRTEGLHATFTAQLNGGTGADGLTFAMLDPAKDRPTWVGSAGSGLGLANFHGVAVTLNTYKTSQVGVATVNGAAPTWLKTAAPASSLRSGTHAVDVTVTGGHVTVAIDGRQLLDVVPPSGTLRPVAMTGFTGATGGYTDVHAVSGVRIATAAATGLPLSPSPASADFAEVQVGTTNAQTVTLTDQSAQPEVVTAVKGPAAPFSATLPAIGTTVNPGASISVPVTFRPTSDGTVTGSLTVTTTSGSAVVALTGTGDDQIPDLTTSTWTTAGSATLSGDTVTLTQDGQKSTAGLIVNSFKVDPIGVHAVFTAHITGNHATGADGLTFALIDGTVAKPTTRGGVGSGLGIAGFPATFVALDTYNNTGVTSKNFAGIGTAKLGSGTVSFLSTSTSVPALRTGTHLVDVRVTTASHLVVRIDGRQYLDTAVSLPSRVMAAFTGSVGGYSDTHAVINPVITYTGT